MAKLIKKDSTEGYSSHSQGGVDVNIGKNGLVLPDWNKVKSTLNPKNWGVPDYSDKGDFNTAYSTARKAGEKEFMWNNKRYTTEQLGERRDFPVNKSVREYIYKTIAPSEYPTDDVSQRIGDVIFNRKRMSSLDEHKAILNDMNKQINTRDVNPGWYEKLRNATNEDSKRFYKISEGYGVHDEDLWRFYLGLPQINNVVQKSKYTPTNAKNKNAIYYTLKEDLGETTLELGDSPDYKKKILSHAFQDQQKFPKQINIRDISGLANMTVDKGMDDRGEYISFYDIYDFDIPFEDKIGRKYEIYDRIYYKDYGDGNYTRMYYSDKELSELDVNKKNFDTLALQRELSNRGYRLFKSSKKDGTFDGILGDETKNALLDYQSKNKTKVQGNTYVASKLLPKAAPKLLR